MIETIIIYVKNKQDSIEKTLFIKYNHLNKYLHFLHLFHVG